MIFVLPAAAALTGAAIGYWLGIGQRWAWFLGAGLGRVSLAVLAVLPLEIGALVGAGSAVIRNRRSRHD